MSRRSAWALMALLPIAACATSVNPPPPIAMPEPASARPITPFADGGFGTRASELNRLVVEASRSVATNARRPAVRAMARQLVVAHQADLATLQQIAARQSGTLPASLTTRAQTMIADLEKAGRLYEHDYLEDMIIAHQDLVSAYKAESAEGSNGELKDFASASLVPTQRHLAQLQRLARRR